MAFWRRKYPTRLELYGVTEKQFKEMKKAQANLCAICGKPETKQTKWKRPRNLCVDHNHTTGQVRALLCNSCNWTLGLVGEDPTILENMIRYLEEWKKKGEGKEYFT